MLSNNGLLFCVIAAAAFSGISSAQAFDEPSSSRGKRDVPDILLPDALHDGRKRLSEQPLWCRELTELRQVRPEVDAAELELACHLCLLRMQAASRNADSEQVNSVGKRFLDSLVRPGSIYGRRRGKRFLDSLVRPSSIYSGRRKRFFDSLVRPNSIYNGKRSAVAGRDFWTALGQLWCPV